MSQMIDAISFCHEKKYHFDIGSLNEFNIYLSETLDHCFIDPGFFHDEDDEIPRYYTENEFGDEKTTKSEQDDIFAIGMVFFRLITLLSIEEFLILSLQLVFSIQLDLTFVKLKLINLHCNLDLF